MRGTAAAATSAERFQGSARRRGSSTSKGISPSLVLRVPFRTSRRRLSFGLVGLLITVLQHLEREELVELLAVEDAGLVVRLRGAFPSNRSERPQNTKRDRPLPSFLETTRIDGVKAPQHRRTPR